jgi:hypothetical protein
MQLAHVISNTHDAGACIDGLRDEHGRLGRPPRRPTVRATLHDTTRPASTPRLQATRPRRCQRRQGRFDITDEQELEGHAGNRNECDEPTSSHRKTNTQAHEIR